MTTSAKFDWSSRFWSTPTRKILVMPDGAHPPELPDSIEILPVPSTTDVVNVLGVLGEHGFHKILCEGGRQLYASLCGRQAVDEIFSTVTPWCQASDGVPMTPELTSPQRIDLITATVVNQEIFLRYRFPSGRSWLDADTAIPVPHEQATTPQEVT
jgi:riboflavin biosynthesis pyrimidine reductase